MARVGIDLGTTNLVVALADRGNYPVLTFGSGGGDRLSMPSLVALRDEALRVGWEALEGCSEPGWELISSPKRLLGTPEPEPLHARGGRVPPIEELIYCLLGRLHKELLACPYIDPDEEIEAMVGVPANANSLQRLRTLTAARRAGFAVRGLLHEPTAAAIEYAHRHPAFGKGRERRHLLVYDLGGGTFDVALVRVDRDGFTVLCASGIERLGGDDFDRAMAELALAKAGLRYDALPPGTQSRLLLRCREAKEALRGTTKKWLLDLDELYAGEVALYMAEFAECCQPLIEQSVAAVEHIVASSGLELEEIDALLLVGGSGQLPLVQRRLKALVGTRLKISPHPFASTAVGLAIHLERAHEQAVAERLTRHFGVWREAEDGTRPSFDLIFSGDTALPPPGQTLVARRVYHPAHNIGHLRFEECAVLDQRGAPSGHRTPWCEIHFPFDPALPPNDPLTTRRIERGARFTRLTVEERYECDSQGLLTVRISRAEPELVRSYMLYGPEQVAALPAPRRPSTGSGRTDVSDIRSS